MKVFFLIIVTPIIPKKKSIPAGSQHPVKHAIIVKNCFEISNSWLIDLPRKASNTCKYILE